MNQMLSLSLSAILLGGLCSARPSLAGTSDAVVLQWNEIAVQAVGATAPFPSTRAMATVQVAVFEAVNAITYSHTPCLGTVSAPDGASADAPGRTLGQRVPVRARRRRGDLEEIGAALRTDPAKAGSLPVLAT
jgi:hypothetical protein